ncbi:hypothetical protein HDK90DRAFT_144170 [Phyllosticta capitalensis]|uniref:3-hydroxyisobutyrate dehydrogenase protein n=1 Tax=Phyllosticta capitalensis TaxID=121624 RepID=A0ABR1YZD4_9PEZI
MESTAPLLESQASDQFEASGTTEHDLDGHGSRQRIPVNDHDEWYLRPCDGRLSRLSVQSFEDLRTDEPVTWIRIGRPKNQTPAYLQVLYWTYPSLNPDARRRQRTDSKGSLFRRWIPSCAAIIFYVIFTKPKVRQSLMFMPQRRDKQSESKKYMGNYNPIGFQDSPDIHEWRQEDVGVGEEHDLLLVDYGHPEGDAEFHGSFQARSSTLPQHTSLNLLDDIDTDFDDLPARHLGPRYLCFLSSEEDEDRGTPAFETRLVTEWIDEKGPGANTDFVFVSYTRKQFFVTEENELSGWNITEETRQHYRQIAPQDRRMLQSYGVRAARKAGVAAFWLDFECLQSSGPDGEIDDVWRICDIVRACHSMIIMLGPSIDAKDTPVTPQARETWLHEWGTRLWTLPEILLMPEPKVSIYTVGGDERPEVLAKRNFAPRAWKDAKLVRQLIDHYESSLHLTQLELLSIGLECFQSRQTDQRNEGDMAYALMGLLRRRPKVNKNDSGFNAFARLSLANDSDRLLERMLCMFHPQQDAAWFHIRDVWGARLWDIEPTVQIGEILGNETVSLEGAYGATIEWDEMKPPAFFIQPTSALALAASTLLSAPFWLFFGLIFTSFSTFVYGTLDSELKGNPFRDLPNLNGLPLQLFIGISIFFALGCIKLSIFLITTVAGPATLLHIYGLKIRCTEARLIGVEGRLDLGVAESYLFGLNNNRLKWDTNGSSVDFDSLGRPKWNASAEHTTGHVVGHNSPDKYGMRLFTLIDTFTMKATPFRAKRPPTSFIICGQQGGMQRVLLCSYNNWNRTFRRETVIRASTLVRDRISRVDRFKLALGRQDDGRISR